MNIIRKYILILLVLLSQFFTNAAFAQTDYRSTTKNSVLVGINSDGFLGLEGGYNYKSSFTINENEVYLGSRLIFPILINIKENNIQDWEAKFSAESRIFQSLKYNIGVTISLHMIEHTQVLGNFFTLGNDVKITPFYIFKSKAYIGLQFELINSITTYINPSDYVESAYRELYDKNNVLINDSPTAGWYKSTGTFFKTGIDFFTPVFEKTGFYLDLGLQYFNSEYFSYFDNMTAGFVPFYLSISVTYSLK